MQRLPVQIFYAKNAISNGSGGSYLWMGMQTFSRTFANKDPRQHGPPGARAPTPFYIAVFSDISVFFKSCQILPQFTFVATVQMQLQKKKTQKRSPLHPVILSPEVIEGHGLKY